jgi:hypothetical protein
LILSEEYLHMARLVHNEVAVKANSNMYMILFAGVL